MEILKDHDGGRVLMTVREVADYLRFSPAKVYKMARAGEVPAARIGKEWRFKRDLLDDWIQESVRTNTESVEKDG